MRIVKCIALLALLNVFSLPALAIDAPFTWPDSFMVTDKITSISKPDQPPFLDAFRQDGLKARNQHGWYINGTYEEKNFHDSPEVEIFRLDLHKRFGIMPDGTVHEKTLPADWPMSRLFPLNRPWELLGKDTVNGMAALKYKIVRDPAKVAKDHQPSFMLVWLTEDNKTPLRREYGDDRLDFLNYVPGPQDPKWFEAEGVK